MSKKKVSKRDQALRSWLELNKNINDLTEEDLEWMLSKETKRTEPRTTVIQRIKSRLVQIATDKRKSSLDGV